MAGKERPINIGQEIKEARLAQGHSMETLGQYLGINRSNVSRFETGESQWTFEQVVQALEFLGLEIKIIKSRYAAPPQAALEILQKESGDIYQAAKCLAAHIKQAYDVNSDGLTEWLTEYEYNGFESIESLAEEWRQTLAVLARLLRGEE